MLPPKGYSLCSKIRHNKLELKHNPIVIPPLNVEIHSVEFTLPKPKVECVLSTSSNSSVTGTFILTEDRYSHVWSWLTRSFYILYVCCSFLDNYVFGRTALLVSNMHHSRKFRICYYHILTISHNHFHSPNVNLIQFRNSYIKSVSFRKWLFVLSH